ncbi:MAG: FHA domain-containing protein [Planctomycetota bacterium]|nr:FHA domain-containing protein [Planctomycetota bacterium]
MAALLVPMDGGVAFRIEKPIVLIGRHQECDLPLPAYVKVSRRHCCIVQAGERYLVRDLGSMNGLRVNGKRVNESELISGDEVSVADAVFVFQNGAVRTAVRGVAEVSGTSVRTGISANRPDPQMDSARKQEATDREDLPQDKLSLGKSNDSHTGSKFVEV